MMRTLCTCMNWSTSWNQLRDRDYKLRHKYVSLGGYYYTALPDVHVHVERSRLFLRTLDDMPLTIIRQLTQGGSVEYTGVRTQVFFIWGGGGTRPSPPSLASVVHTFEAVAGSRGSVSAPAVNRVMGGAPERNKTSKKI